MLIILMSGPTDCIKSTGKSSASGRPERPVNKWRPDTCNESDIKNSKIYSHNESN